MRAGDEMGLLFVRLRQNHHELIPAVAGKDIATPQHLMDAVGHLDEKDIADGMTVGIVDALEVVEIKDEQGEFVVVAGGALRLVAKQFPENTLIVEVGQGIPRGIKLQVLGVLVDRLGGADNVEQSSENAVDHQGTNRILHLPGDAEADSACNTRGFQQQGFALQAAVREGLFFRVRSGLAMSWEMGISAADTGYPSSLAICSKTFCSTSALPASGGWADQKMSSS